MRLHAKLLLVVAIALAQRAAWADTLVEWTGDYVSVGYTINLQGRIAGAAIPFSELLLRSPNNTNDYYARAGAGASTNFYGGAVVDPATHALVSYKVDPSGSGSVGDYVNCSAGTSGLGQGTNTTAVWVWKKDDFLNQAGAFNVTVTSLFSYVGLLYGANNAAYTRLLVKQGATYFISQASADGATIFGSRSLNNVTWYAYDPASSMNVIGSVATPAFDAVNNGISNVTALGVWLYGVRDIATANGNGTRLNGLTALGFAIPEPGMLAGLLLAGLAAARRMAQG